MNEQMELQAFKQYDSKTGEFIGYKVSFLGPSPVCPDKMTCVSPYGMLHETMACDPTPEEAIQRAERHLASRGYRENS